jgi:hypothetical protein
MNPIYLVGTALLACYAGLSALSPLGAELQASGALMGLDAQAAPELCTIDADDADDLDIAIIIDEDSDGDATDRWFHIVSGPRKSHKFLGEHRGGMVFFSSYNETPWGKPFKNIWVHIENGANKSLYRPIGPDANADVE